MKIQIGGLLAVVVFVFTPQAFAKRPFDGAQGLLCTVSQLHECTSHAGCERVPVVAADDIRYVNFDLKNKTARLAHWDPGLTSSINTLSTVDDNLLLQGTDAGDTGTDDGAGWTMSLNSTYGTMVLTVSGRDVAFVGMGSCVPAIP